MTPPPSTGRDDGPVPRLFVAAFPTPELHAALRTLPPVDEPGVRPVPPEQWHVTLRFVGEADEGELTALLSNAELPRVTARLGPRTVRLGPRVIAVPVSGVDALAAAVRAATAGVGEQDRRPFRGHLTIARTRPDAGSQLVGTPLDGRFDIDEIALVRSELNSTGAVYTTAARFATGDATPCDARAAD